MTVSGGFPAPGPQDQGPPSSWQPATPITAGSMARPQTPMLTAHKPGIVPLRPLLLGDILDGAVKAVRFSPKPMIGFSAMVLAVFLVPSAAAGIGTTRLAIRVLRNLGPGAEIFLGIPASVIQALFTGLATALLSGILCYVVGQAVLGRKPTIRATWRSTRGRVPSLLGLGLLSTLFSLLVLVLLIGPGVLLLTNDSVGAGLLALFVGLLGLMVVGLAFSTKISMAAPAMVLENLGVVAGLRRSFSLTKGAAFWRILGITLLAGLIASVVGSLLGIPLSLVGGGVAALSGQDPESAQMIITFTSHLSALLTGAITTPFVAAVTCLLYIDRRMRLEALDVILLREAQTNPAPRI
jgi:hypothetical protein